MQKIHTTDAWWVNNKFFASFLHYPFFHLKYFNFLGLNPEFCLEIYVLVLNWTLQYCILCIQHIKFTSGHTALSVNAFYSLHSTVLYCIALYCTALYSTLLHCTTLLHCHLLHCTLLNCTLLNCTLLNCTLLHCTLLHYILLHCTLLHCTLINCTILHSTILH